MFDEDLLDEEIKKKKRRILVLLFVLLLLGTIVAFPLAELSPPSSPTATEAVAEAPAHTATAARPTLAPASTSTSAPMPTVEATTVGPTEATPQPTATVAVTRMTATVTQETPSGAGGGMPDVSPTATSAPTSTPPTLATPTLMEPSELPATGADVSRGVGWLGLGVVATLLATLMFGAGCALHNTKLRQR